MEIPAVQAAKGFAESEIADDVEGEKVVPLDNVDDLVSLGELMDLIHEQVDEAMDEGLLLQQSLLGEAVREGLALAAVIVAVGHGYVGDAGYWVDGSDVAGIRFEIEATSTMTLDIYESLGRVEGEFVR